MKIPNKVGLKGQPCLTQRAPQACASGLHVLHAQSSCCTRTGLLYLHCVSLRCSGRFSAVQCILCNYDLLIRSWMTRCFAKAKHAYALKCRCTKCDNHRRICATMHYHMISSITSMQCIILCLDQQKAFPWKTQNPRFPAGACCDVGRFSGAP